MPRPSIADPAARVLALLLLFAALGCDGEVRAPETPSRPPNFIVIVADDVGTGQVGIYGHSGFAGRTPNIDRLGREGLVFDRFWSMPACSSTRAALMTGEYPSRYGVGSVVDRMLKKDRKAGRPLFGLPETSFTVPRALAQAGYTSAMLGKWHLGTEDQGLDHPLHVGFDVFRGSFANLNSHYFSWRKVVAGAEKVTETYATTDTTNDAIALAGALTEPWLIVVSYNAAHGPVHVPPAELHGFGQFDPKERQQTAYHAMVEAMDSEIGRMVAATASHDPFIVFLGDNGAPGWARKKSGRGKGSVYEAGVHAPFILHHSSIEAPGRTVAGLVGVTDVFATLVALSRADIAPEQMPRDSVSLAPVLRSASASPVRDWLYTERFIPNGPRPWRRHDRAVRDERYKLIQRDGGAGKLYDLIQDPGEKHPLRDRSQAAAAAFARLARLSGQLPAVRATAE